jgi:hypothetical protein
VLGDKAIEAGELVVFVEVDSLLPERAEFEFLRDRCWREQFGRFLIRPMKMAGVISMGIVFRLSILPPRKKPYIAGEDVTAILNILKHEAEESGGGEKYVPPAFVAFLLRHKVTKRLGKALLKWLRPPAPASKAFPAGLIEKSDETTIQNCPEVLPQHADTLSYATIKLEGQSATFLYDWDYKKKKLGAFFVCSHGVAYYDRKNPSGWSFWKLADDINAAELILQYYKKTGKLLAIQGERCGPGVQKNIYRLPVSKLFLYTARDVVSGNYLNFGQLKEFSNFSGIPTVPEIPEWYNVPLKNIISDVAAADAVSTRYFKFTSDAPDGIDFLYKLQGNEKPAFQKNDIYFHEGIVVRGMKGEFSFKIKSPDYAYWFS